MVKNENNWWDKELRLPQSERGSHASETFNSLSAPLQEIARTNPAIADELANLYKRVLSDVFSRLIRSDDSGKTRKLSDEHTKQLVAALSLARIDFPTFG